MAAPAVFWAGEALAQSVAEPSPWSSPLGASRLPRPEPHQAPVVATPPGEPSDQDTLKALVDQTHRMTTEVFIDGQGPFSFLVDTGADHSVVSREVAEALNLAAGQTMVVHGVAGDVSVPSARVAEFRVGSRSLQNVSLPLLERSNVGAAGVLGIDVLQGQRVLFDFRGNRILITTSQERHATFDEVVVHARSRFGQLVLVDSSLDDHPILVVIDTGAEDSIANLAFQRRVAEEQTERTGEIAAIFSVTGQKTTGSWAVIPNVQIGGFRLRHLPVVFSELMSFQRWQLSNQPTLLLGMDVLRLFDAVEIDFARREVHFSGLHAAEDLPRVRLAGQRVDWPHA